jgi:hypothetical protein
VTAESMEEDKKLERAGKMREESAAATERRRSMR